MNNSYLYKAMSELSDNIKVTNAIKEQGLMPDGDDYHFFTDVIPSSAGYWWAEVGCALSSRTFARADVTYLVAMYDSKSSLEEAFRNDFELRIINTFINLIKCVDQGAYNAHLNSVR